MDMRNASVGNFFFTGARLFMNSLDAAVFWFSRVASVGPRVSVIPAVLRNTSIGIGARLDDGSSIVGQSAISHPPKPGDRGVDKDSSKRASHGNQESRRNLTPSVHRHLPR